MRIEILVGRTTLPPVGTVLEWEEIPAQELIAKGLAKPASKTNKKAVSKKKLPSTEGETDGKQEETEQ